MPKKMESTSKQLQKKKSSPKRRKREMTPSVHSHAMLIAKAEAGLNLFPNVKKIKRCLVQDWCAIQSAKKVSLELDLDAMKTAPMVGRKCWVCQCARNLRLTIVAGAIIKN